MKKHKAKRLKEDEKKIQKKAKKKDNLKENKKADKKSAKHQKGQAENELFNFDNEMVIGVTKLPEPKKQKKEKKTQKSKNKQKTRKNNTKPKGKLPKEKNANKTNKRAKPNKKIDLKKEKRKRRMLSFVKGALITTVIIGAILALMLSPLFSIKEIIVEGNAKITENEIKILSEINVGDNLFTTNNNTAINKIKNNPYIEEVEIDKQSPDKIVIKIKERKATYAIKCNNKYVYINNQGYILEEAESSNNLIEIVSYKTPTEQIKLGGRLLEEDLDLLGTILKITESANNNGLANLITSIDIGNKSDIILKIASEGKTVYIGNASDINTKMMYIKVIIDDEKGIEGDIIIDSKLNSEKVIFRKKI